MSQPTDYNLFIQLFESFKPKGFNNIDSTNLLVHELEEKMKVNKQFLIIGDMITVQVLHASPGYYDFFGNVSKESFTLRVFDRTHPQHKVRHSTARTRLFKMSQDMYNDLEGKMFISTNLTIKNQHEKYVDLMFQCYLTFSEIPYRSVFVVIVLTDISELAKMKHGYHFYSGKDASYFTFPDSVLLIKGNMFTNREYEIINCIAEGLDSEQIAEKLFLSRHTVNTHRRNILNKTGMRNTHELVIDLKQKGVI